MTAVANEQIARRVVLIDLSSIYWSCFHATANEPVSQASALTLVGIRRCYKDGDLVAICCDQGRSFRKDKCADYKANRPEKDQSALDELRRLKERLVKDGFLLWAADGFEADDVIATAVKMSPPHEVLVCSADHDLLQLAGPGVRILRTHSWVEGGEAEVKAKYGVEPSKLRDLFALAGDTSDNIRGAKGIGPKTAAELLNAHGSIDEIYRAIAKGKQVTTPARMKALIDDVAYVDLAVDLVTLRTDAPIVWNEIYAERKVERLSGAAGVCPACELPENDCSCTMGDEMSEDDIPISAGPGIAAKQNPQQQAQAAQLSTSAAHAAQEIPASIAGARLGPPEVPVEAETKEQAHPRDKTPAEVEAVSRPTSTALTRVPVAYEQALEPTSPDGAYKMAKYIADSRLYTRFPNQDAIFAVIVRGRELGLGALTALDSFHIVEGKPCPHAHLIVSMAEARSDCEYFMLVSSSAEECTYETKHRNQPRPVRHTYRIQDAVDAGLCGLALVPRTAKPGEKDSRGNWDKRRAEMLRKTCAVQLVRIVYPSAAMGLYAAFELGGDE